VDGSSIEWKFVVLCTTNQVRGLNKRLLQRNAATATVAAQNKALNIGHVA